MSKLEQFALLGEDRLAKLKKDAVSEKDLLASIPRLSHPEKIWTGPICAANLCFYIDRFGDFFSKGTKTAKIAQAVFDSLPTKSKQEVTMYLMDATMEDDS